MQNKKKEDFQKYNILIHDKFIISLRFKLYTHFFLETKTATQVTPENDDDMWNNFSPDLKEIIQIPELAVDTIEARPYDPISEVPMEDQK